MKEANKIKRKKSFYRSIHDQNFTYNQFSSGGRGFTSPIVKCRKKPIFVVSFHEGRKKGEKKRKKGGENSRDIGGGEKGLMVERARKKERKKKKGGLA